MLSVSFDKSTWPALSGQETVTDVQGIKRVRYGSPTVPPRVTVQLPTGVSPRDYLVVLRLYRIVIKSGTTAAEDNVFDYDLNKSYNHEYCYPKSLASRSRNTSRMPWLKVHTAQGRGIGRSS